MCVSNKPQCDVEHCGQFFSKPVDDISTMLANGQSFTQVAALRIVRWGSRGSRQVQSAGQNFVVCRDQCARQPKRRAEILQPIAYRVRFASKVPLSKPNCQMQSFTTERIHIGNQSHLHTCSLARFSLNRRTTKQSSVPADHPGFTGALLFVGTPAGIVRSQFYSIIKLLKSISSKSLLGAS